MAEVTEVIFCVSVDELQDVWSDYWAGDEDLKCRLTLQYAPLVKFVAARHHADPEPGLERLTAAISQYKPEDGRFESFAIEQISSAYDQSSWESDGWAEVG